jgi:hypothetical protein
MLRLLIGLILLDPDPQPCKIQIRIYTIASENIFYRLLKSRDETLNFQRKKTYIEGNDDTMDLKDNLTNISLELRVGPDPHRTIGRIRIWKKIIRIRSNGGHDSTECPSGSKNKMSRIVPICVRRAFIFKST